jgi:hypothetical protein
MTVSYNGWTASQAPAAIGVAPFIVNGVPFPGGVRSGDVAAVFRYLVEQFARRVEGLITPGCWGYYYKQSANSAALLSCHSSGTAIDINAPRHPNGKRGTFTAAQVAQIRAILAELSGVVYWGGDAWGDGTPDEMHFEIQSGVTAAQVAAAARKLGTTSSEEFDMATSEELKNLIVGYGRRIERIDVGEGGALGSPWGYGRRIEDIEDRVIALQAAVAAVAANGSALTAEQIEAAVTKALRDNAARLAAANGGAAGA